MKSILMSIQPYYAYLEMKGIKTVEMRKTETKDKEWSGKVKVYVSQNKKSFNRIPKEDREWFTQYVGKVAYEFVCDKVICLTYETKIPTVKQNEDGTLSIVGYTTTEPFYNGKLSTIKGSCLEQKQLVSYGKGKTLYGLHITALKIYDKPRELNDYGLFCKDYVDCADVLCQRDTCREGFVSLARPPQSWQYVELPYWAEEK